MATSQEDGDGYDTEDSTDAAMEATQAPAPSGQGAMNPKRQASLNRELRRNQAYASARTESIKANTEAIRQATAAKATEMASRYLPMPSSYRRNSDGTYTQNGPFSPDAQSDSTASSDSAPQGSTAMAEAVAPSRLDAFRASQKTQTANENLNGIAAGTGGHSWDADNPQNAARAAKIAQAVQNVKDTKLAQGINPATNEYIEPSDAIDITGSVRGDLDQSASNSAGRRDELNSRISSSVKNGDMSGALSMQPAANAANRSASTDARISNNTNSVTMTPYGVIATSRGNLGTGGLERLMATPAVQSAAKASNAPAAMAAVTPSQKGGNKSAITSSTPPQQVKQAAYVGGSNPLIGAVSPKPQKPTGPNKKPLAGA